MINFPNAPAMGQVFTSGGTSWAWDGGKWTAASGASVAYAPLASPTFTGDPQAPTPATSDNDTSVATTAFVKSAIVAAGQIFYCDLTDAADVATYKRLLLTPSTHAETTASAVCTGTTTDFLIASFITDIGVPGAIEYPAGSAYRRLYGSVSGGAARFRLQVYSRTVGGVETLARDEVSNNFTDTTATLQEWLATPSAAGVLSVSDRIVVKISARRISGPTNVTVTLYTEGNSHASQIQTTISPSSSAPISATPPLALTGGNLTVDLSAYATTSAMTTADNLRVLKAGDVMTGALTVTAPVSSTGGTAGLAFENRVTPGSQWQWYADAGGAHLFLGANELTVDVTGNATLAGMLSVSGNAKAALGLYAGYTSLWGPDGGPAAQDRGIFLSNTATAQAVYRHSSHAIQDAAGVSSFLQIGGTGSVFGAPTGGAKGAGTVNAVSVYASNVLLTSDAELKRDIEALPVGCLATVEAVEPKSWLWAEEDLPERPNGEGYLTLEEFRPPGFYDRRNRGFLAQDVAAAIEGDGSTVDLGGLVAVLWRAVQELSAKVAVLEGKPAA